MQLKIVIWDTDPARIGRIDRNLHQAFKLLGIKGVVTCNSEPPSLARAKLFDKLPVLEINGKHWRCKEGVPSVDACVDLLQNKIGRAGYHLPT